MGGKLFGEVYMYLSPFPSFEPPPQLAPHPTGGKLFGEIYMYLSPFPSQERGTTPGSPGLPARAVLRAINVKGHSFRGVAKRLAVPPAVAPS